MDLLTRVTTGTNLGTTGTRDALVQTAVRQTIMYQPTSRASRRSVLVSKMKMRRKSILKFS